MGESVGLGQSHLILGTKTILDPKLTLYCLGTQSRDTLLILSWSFAPPMKSKRSSPAKVPRTSLRLSSRDPWRTHHPTHCPIAGSISQYFKKNTFVKGLPFPNLLFGWFSFRWEGNPPRCLLSLLRHDACQESLSGSTEMSTVTTRHYRANEFTGVVSHIVRLR